MTESMGPERKDMVIRLYAKKSDKDCIERCDRVIAAQLALARNEGWQPCIPTDFEYLEKNGYVKSHKEGWATTIAANAASLLLSAPAISATQVVYDSVMIPLCRERDH